MARKTSKKSAKVAKTTAAKRVSATPTLLARSNPQIAEADGDAPTSRPCRAGNATSSAAWTRSSCAPFPACARRSNGTRPSTESRGWAGSSASIA